MLVTIVLTLIVLILIKGSKTFKKNFYKNVYENNISFARFNKLYNEHFGDILPIDIKDTKPVFNEELLFEDQEKYLDGVKLKVDSNYLVPVLKSGVVVFVGEKDDYGKVVIINQEDGIDLWYGNMDNISVSLYDTVKKGQFIGSADKELILVYKKNGSVLDYEKYI